MESVDVLSGVQPTGHAHLGNYLGAFRNWLDLQSEHRCFYCIVDLHALTTSPDPDELRVATYRMAETFLAIGLDPEHSTLFRQSDVPEHAELAWILQCLTPMGDLSRMTQFKDKSASQPKNINAGLFTYPVLQAADILLYRPRMVPVGDDQLQHLELTREIARRFNRRYGDYLPEPEALLTKAPRILGLDGENKMSKSLNNEVPLMATHEEIGKRIATAVTDPQRIRRDDPGNPEVCNVFSLHGHFTESARCSAIDQDCRGGSIGCVDCKRELADSIASALLPSGSVPTVSLPTEVRSMRSYKRVRPRHER